LTGLPATADTNYATDWICGFVRLEPNAGIPPPPSVTWCGHERVAVDRRRRVRPRRRLLLPHDLTSAAVHGDQLAVERRREHQIVADRRIRPRI
jgi:hypothetical protein